MADKKVEVKMVRSLIGCNQRQRNTLRALGLRKIGSVRKHTMNDTICGMIDKVHHLVEVKDAK